MTNSRIHAAIALGSALFVGAFVAFLPPIPPASAQSHAQRICRERADKERAPQRDGSVDRLLVMAATPIVCKGKRPARRGGCPFGAATAPFPPQLR